MGRTALLCFVLEESSAVSTETGHRSDRVFVKLPSLGIQERVRHARLCSCVRALALGTARSLSLPAGMRLRRGLCLKPTAGHTLRLRPQTHVRCRFASSQTQAEKACGDASSSLRQDEQSASLRGCFTPYLKQRLQLSVDLRSVHLTSGDKQRAARVLEPGQG